MFFLFSVIFLLFRREKSKIPQLMEKEVQTLIKTLKDCSQKVIGELGGGWVENIYQVAMEVALRDQGIMYETQRILPITFAGHVIGESIPDLVVWLKSNGKKVAVVVDLKADTGIKEDHQVQVERYIKELRKQVHSDEEVYPNGFVVNFVKEATSQKLKDGFEELSGVQVLEVSA